MTDIEVRHLRRIGLNVKASAFDATVAYYEGPWGLERVETDSGSKCVALRGTGPEHHVLSLTAAPTNGIEHLGLALADRRAVDSAADELRRRGERLLAEPGPLDAPGGGYGLRLADPEGRVIELSTSVMAVRPMAPSTTPIGLTHVVLNTVDMDRARAWWCEVLGFRVSDYSEDQMVFLRCNADHHAIAFTRADFTSVNHMAYVVPSLDAFMVSLGRLQHNGHRPAWGPGRHGPGNNAFGYFIDPAGLVPEVTAEVEQIDEASHVPRVWPRIPGMSDLWGTAGPPSDEVRAHMAGVEDPTAAGVVR